MRVVEWPGKRGKAILGGNLASLVLNRVERTSSRLRFIPLLFNGNIFDSTDDGASFSLDSQIIKTLYECIEFFPRNAYL